MATGATGTLDTNTGDAVEAAITLTTESILTMYAYNASGAHGGCRLVIEVSPAASGDVWSEVGRSLPGAGMVTVQVAALRARVKVEEAQGDASTMTVHLLAR